MKNRITNWVNINFNKLISKLKSFFGKTQGFDPSCGHPAYAEIKNRILNANSRALNNAFALALAVIKKEQWDSKNLLIVSLAEDRDLQTRILRFHKANSKDWFANLLLGIHLSDLSYREREGNYLFEMSDSSVQKYESLLEDGGHYLREAYRLNPECAITCTWLISFYSSSGENFDVIKEIYQQGIQAEPQNMFIREAYYEALLPKWSGFDWEVSEQYLNAQLQDKTLALAYKMKLDYVVEYGINFFESNSEESDRWDSSEEVKEICLNVAEDILKTKNCKEKWFYISTCNRLLFVAYYAQFDPIPQQIIDIALMLKPSDYREVQWSEYDHTFEEIDEIVKDLQKGIPTELV